MGLPTGDYGPSAGDSAANALYGPSGLIARVSALEAQVIALDQGLREAAAVIRLHEETLIEILEDKTP